MGTNETSIERTGMNRQIKHLTVAVYVVLCLGGIGQGEPFHRIPEADRAILSLVAQEYRLTAEQRRLLFAIYVAEGNQKDRAAGLLEGHEMGVLVPAAQRFKGDHARSLNARAVGRPARSASDIPGISQRLPLDGARRMHTG
jgi:hypothetical protein